MLNRSQIVDVVYRAIDQVNELLFDENAISKKDTTILVGEGTNLDSMGFVNLVVALEEELSQSIGLDFNLVEELNAAKVNSQRWSNVAELVDFLLVLSKTKQLGLVEGRSI